MSGGSWDYVYYRVDEVADRLLQSKSAKRRALGKHLKLVAQALHDIEWVDSSDYADGDDFAAIDKALKGPRPTELSILLEDAKALKAELEKAIAAEERLSQ